MNALEILISSIINENGRPHFHKQSRRVATHKSDDFLLLLAQPRRWIVALPSNHYQRFCFHPQTCVTDDERQNSMFWYGNELKQFAVAGDGAVLIEIFVFCVLVEFLRQGYRFSAASANNRTLDVRKSLDKRLSARK